MTVFAFKTQNRPEILGWLLFSLVIILNYFTIFIFPRFFQRFQKLLWIWLKPRNIFFQIQDRKTCSKSKVTTIENQLTFSKFRTQWYCLQCWHGAWISWISRISLLNPVSTNPTKWSNTLKQFLGNSQRVVWVGLIILWGWCLND